MTRACTGAAAAAAAPAHARPPYTAAAAAAAATHARTHARTRTVGAWGGRPTSWRRCVKGQDAAGGADPRCVAHAGAKVALAVQRAPQARRAPVGRRIDVGVHVRGHVRHDGGCAQSRAQQDAQQRRRRVQRHGQCSRKVGARVLAFRSDPWHGTHHADNVQDKTVSVRRWCHVHSPRRRPCASSRTRYRPTTACTRTRRRPTAWTSSAGTPPPRWPIYKRRPVDPRYVAPHTPTHPCPRGAASSTS